MKAWRDRLAGSVGALAGLVAAGLFLGVLFAIQLGADQLVLTVSNWLFGSN